MSNLFIRGMILYALMLWEQGEEEKCKVVIHEIITLMIIKELEDEYRYDLDLI